MLLVEAVTHSGGVLFLEYCIEVAHVQLRVAGNGSTSKGESNALCELSELVHKVGSVRDSTCSEVRTDGNCAQSVFTCLQCSRSYETLDELVLHISTTKHFTRMATKRVEPMSVIFCAHRLYSLLFIFSIKRRAT